MIPAPLMMFQIGYVSFNDVGDFSISSISARYHIQNFNYFSYFTGNLKRILLYHGHPRLKLHTESAVKQHFKFPVKEVLSSFEMKMLVFFYEIVSWRVVILFMLGEF